MTVRWAEHSILHHSSSQNHTVTSSVHATNTHTHLEWSMQRRTPPGPCPQCLSLWPEFCDSGQFLKQLGINQNPLRMCPPANFTLGCHAVQNRAFFTCVFDYCSGVVVLLTGPQEPNETFLPSPSAISSPQDWLICTGEVDVDMRGTGWNMCLHIWQRGCLAHE